MICEPPPALTADPCLPQRDLLLDAEAITARLATRLGTRGPIAIERCERWRVKYRIGESLRVLYRVRVRGEWYPLAARAFRDGRSEAAYRRVIAGAIPCEPLRPIIHDPEIDAVFWTFPNDRKITNLPALMRVQEPLAALLARPWTASRLVAYAPEKSATAQCLDAAGVTLAYAKVYAGDEGRQAYDIYGSLQHFLPADHPHLGLPRALGYAPAQRVLLLEAVSGRRIADLQGARLLSGLERLGAALATLHSLPAPGAPHFARFDPDRLWQAARLIGRSRPDVAARADALAAALSEGWEPARGPLVCLHGDIHAKNGILAHNRVTLIDLDQAQIGPAAADLGSMLAGLRYLARIGQSTRAEEYACAGALLRGYAALRPLPPAHDLRRHTAAALLTERALRAVNRVRAPGLLHLEGIVDDALLLTRWRGEGVNG